MNGLKWRGWVAVLIMALAPVSCTRFDPIANDAKEIPPGTEVGSLEDRLNAVIRIHLTSDPVTLDPWLAEDGISLRILNNVMQGLVEYDLDGKLQPALAESWKVSKDGLTLEFLLRSHARWSDGRTVKAEEFAAGIRHALSPSTPSKLAPLIANIKNARAIRNRTLPMTELGVRISPEDPRKLIIELERPQPWFLHALTLPVAFPLREEILRGNGGKWPDTAPVTGRYRIVERRVDRSIRLEPNLNHWSWTETSGGKRLAEAPRFIVLQVIQDDTTALNLFESGDLDVLARIPALELDRIKRRFRVVTDPFLATFFFSFNLAMPPFNDPEVRRAFSAAIDRAGIVKLTGNGEAPTYSWIPFGLEGGPSDEGDSGEDRKGAFEAPEHLRTALSVVRARGFADLPPVELAYDSSSRNQLVVEKIQADVLKNLGLKLALRPSDWKTHVRQLSTNAPPVWRFGWMAPFRDPISHLQAFTSDDPNNYARYKNPEYDRMISEISRLEAGEKREALIRKAQKLLVEEDAVLVPVFHAAQTHALSARIEGFRVSSFGTIRFDRLQILKSKAD
jgi:oligopeptide transport system substrate-binding protein